MCSSPPSSLFAILQNPSTQLTHFFSGFIRIDPKSAPIHPPGAAPTLTTIYDEGNLPSEFASSATTSPSNSLSKSQSEDPPTTVTAKQKKSKRRKRLGLPRGVVAAPASEGINGTEREKKRVQGIADSLDLGGNLETDLGEGVGLREKSASVVSPQPNRSVRRGDERLVERGEPDGRRARLQESSRMPVGKRRSVG